MNETKACDLRVVWQLVCSYCERVEINYLNNASQCGYGRLCIDAVARHNRL